MNNPKSSFRAILLLVIMQGLVTGSVHAIEENISEHKSSKESKEHEHGSHLECPLPNNVQDIISCALEFHPSIKKENYNLDISDQSLKKESQIPNPTLSSRYTQGKVEGKDVSELEANLAFVLELGGKRSSRQNYAKAQKGEAIANYDLVRAEVKQETILNLYRLRQVLEERNLIKESLTAFSKIISRLKNLPRLSAEQEASLMLFELAHEETKVNESELFEEEKKLEHYFHIATGHSLDEISDLLPAYPKKWPKIKLPVDKNSHSVTTKRLKAKSDIALQELELQKSDAWPNLKIGPSLGIEKEGSVENKMIGFNIQLPIPLFNANGGGKAFARSKLIKAQRSMALSVAEENHERFEQLQVYQSAIRVLNKTMKRNLIEKKHQKIENMYLRGIISSSLYLDSLKQKFSYLKSRNSREMAAITALWNVYKYDGKIFKENI